MTEEFRPLTVGAMLSHNSYARWYDKVTKIMNRLTGLYPDDLANFCYRDAWRDGATPEEAARDALENDTMGSWALLDCEE